MSKLTVNTGSSANFGDGTPLRTAFGYINSNFNELYANALISNNMTVGNSTVNATVNSTSFSGIAVLLANTNIHSANFKHTVILIFNPTPSSFFKLPSCH